MVKRMSTILIIVFLLPAFSIGAETVGNRMAVIGEVAAEIMAARQKGTPLSQIIDSVNESISGHSTRSLVIKIAIDAYKTPRYTTDEYVQRAVSDFRNKWELIVYEALHKKEGL